MMTMIMLSYIVTWVSMIYSYLTAPSDLELWDEEVE